jgi:hypothetical protein
MTPHTQTYDDLVSGKVRTKHLQFIPVLIQNAPEALVSKINLKVTHTPNVDTDVNTTF